ncbi:MAG: hypothetical protein D6780_02190 [Candidatus Dadabacteria bacterium]|nr:MAG: hypothetical protein D6780_02190 [Candidatus Dadabacteria bacterium]
MGLETPVVQLIISQLSNAEVNLAAFGFSFSLMLLFESPIFLILSSAVSLINGKEVYIKFRNFTLIIGTLLSFLMLLTVYLLHSAGGFISTKNPNLNLLIYLTSLILTPVPFFVAFRRFYQGLLIRFAKPHFVTLATLCRLLTTIVLSLVLFNLAPFEGAVTGAIAVVIGTITESVVVRLLARSSVVNLKETKEKKSYLELAKFYLPLAFSSLISVAVMYILNFLMAFAKDSQFSIAGFSILTSLNFLFASLGLAFQDVTLAKLSENTSWFLYLKKALFFLISAVTALYIICFIFPPLSVFIFSNLYKLSVKKVFILQTAAVFTLLRLFVSYLTIWQRALLIHSKRSHYFGKATFLEFTVSSLLMLILTFLSNFKGIYLAAFSWALGRTAAYFYLKRKVKDIIYN